MKADTLANKLREVLHSDIDIKRPVKKAEIQLRGMDNSITTDEILEIVATHGECSSFGIKLGTFRRMKSGLNMIWIFLLLTAAVKLSKVRKLRFGWTRVSVELGPRSLQCFKC